MEGPLQPLHRGESRQQHEPGFEGDGGPAGLPLAEEHAEGTAPAIADAAAAVGNHVFCSIKHNAQTAQPHLHAAAHGTDDAKAPDGVLSNGDAQRDAGPEGGRVRGLVAERGCCSNRGAEHAHVHDREDVLEGDGPGQMEHLVVLGVRVVLDLPAGDAKQGVDNAEKGAEKVVCLAAHLRHPAAQAMPDKERGDETVPHLPRGDQHEERDDRLGHDQQEVELHRFRGLLPRLHGLAMPPVHDPPEVLGHRAGPEREVNGTGGRAGLAPARQQLLVPPLLVLGRLLLLALAKGRAGARH
mmetsp:Transcript_8869/g.24056  ORF Transcript_8869/g.24056 Transcript_8869/m.24056 type:complete len:298 (-) Transcript_8869:947-1840(-)